MKTDQLNLGQLMRYGFCGFFLCLAFVYGRGGSAALTALFSKKESNEALLAAAFFASGAVFYSFYRALLYPLLGLIALFAVYYRSPWNKSDLENISKEGRCLRAWSKSPAFLRFTPIILLVVSFFVSQQWSFRVISLQCVWVTLLTAIYVIACVLFYKRKRSLDILILSVPYIFAGKISERELKLDKERWDSKQNQTGAQHLEEWASQIHLLYTTAFAITFGSAIGAVWSCLPTHDLGNIRCSIPGMFVVQLLLFAAFASDCRRRRFEDHLRRNPLAKPGEKKLQ